MLTSESILITGSSRLYVVGMSMQWANAIYTSECSNIGQTCSGTIPFTASRDAIQYLVVDYATSSILWHKIANNNSDFGAGTTAVLVDKNPSATVNG